MEHYYKRFYEYVEEIIPLTETDKQIIGRTFKAVFLSKDTILESAGKVPQHHNFIVSGGVVATQRFVKIINTE